MCSAIPSNHLSNVFGNTLKPPSSEQINRPWYKKVLKKSSITPVKLSLAIIYLCFAFMLNLANVFVAVITCIKPADNCFEEIFLEWTNDQGDRSVTKMHFANKSYMYRGLRR